MEMDAGGITVLQGQKKTGGKDCYDTESIQFWEQVQVAGSCRGMDVR